MTDSATNWLPGSGRAESDEMQGGGMNTWLQRRKKADRNIAIGVAKATARGLCRVTQTRRPRGTPADPSIRLLFCLHLRSFLSCHVLPAVILVALDAALSSQCILFDGP